MAEHVATYNGTIVPVEVLDTHLLFLIFTNRSVGICFLDFISKKELNKFKWNCLRHTSKYETLF